MGSGLVKRASAADPAFRYGGLTEVRGLAGRSVSRAGENPLRARIGKEGATYATKLVGFLISTVIETVRESLSENPDEKAEKRILKVVATAGPKGVTRNELTRKTQFIRRSMREEYIEDLVDAGEIVVREIEGHVGQVCFLSGING